MAADPTGLDPEAVLNNTSGFVMATIYDGLIRYKPGTVEVEPGTRAELGHCIGRPELHVPSARGRQIP